jgi:hypothetical protein
MRRKITSFHLAELVAILSQVDPLALENRTWTVEVGKTEFDSSDFTPRATVYVNGQEVGWVAMDEVQDQIARGA